MEKIIGNFILFPIFYILLYRADIDIYESVSLKAELGKITLKSDRNSFRKTLWYNRYCSQFNQSYFLKNVTFVGHTKYTYIEQKQI